MGFLFKREQDDKQNKKQSTKIENSEDVLEA